MSDHSDIPNFEYRSEEMAKHVFKIGDKLENIHSRSIRTVAKISEITRNGKQIVKIYTLDNDKKWPEEDLRKHWLLYKGA